MLWIRKRLNIFARASIPDIRMQRIHMFFHFLRVPLLRINIPSVDCNDRLHFLCHGQLNIFMQRMICLINGCGIPDFFQNILPPAINNFPVFVHDIVVLQHMPPKIEVPTFHFFLRALDRSGHDAIFQRHIIRDLQSFHHALQAISAE